MDLLNSAYDTHRHQYRHMDQEHGSLPSMQNIVSGAAIGVLNA